MAGIADHDSFSTPARATGYGLGEQRSRAIPQNLRQSIGKCSWLDELENVSVGHGVSLLQWRSGGVEHPHDTPPYPSCRHQLLRIAPVSLEDLKVPPANRLEKLKGNLKEFYSIRINDQWRVIFRWVNGEAHDVRIVDYH